MQLSVSCPRCESKYQLDAGMRGKRMRCPNPICRAVFGGMQVSLTALTEHIGQPGINGVLYGVFAGGTFAFNNNNATNVPSGAIEVQTSGPSAAPDIAGMPASITISVNLTGGEQVCPSCHRPLAKPGASEGILAKPVPCPICKIPLYPEVLETHEVLHCAECEGLACRHALRSPLGV